ncbi:MAG: hypothetical protein DSO07_04260 [Thermoproteota archaeon]|nr:MAG: hypothetical protein DSO07_04260 [Candidatus Korarchaeota archaeon]
MGEITESIREILEIIAITIVYAPLYIAMLIMVWICSRSGITRICRTTMRIAHIIYKIRKKLRDVFG